MILYLAKGIAEPHKQSRELLMRCLQDYTKGACASAEVSENEFGKPYFENVPVKFSISHTGNLWGCIMSDSDVGLDLQEIKPRVKAEKLAGRFFSEEEYKYVRNNDIYGFFRVWTVKEAYVKYTGRGLFGEGMKEFSVITGNDHKLCLKKEINGIKIEEISTKKINPAEICGAYCFAGENVGLMVKEL